MIRGIILQDAKSATYKLALIRALVVIANLTPALARERGDHVVLPLGLVALHWLRMYIPLLRARLPQAASQSGGRGLGFVKEGFRALRVQPAELRIGARFQGDEAVAMARALRDAARTIATMPARYIRDRSGDPLLRPELLPGVRPSASVRLDEELLWSWGEIAVPEAMWLSFRRHAVWIEPVIVHEWVEQMARFAPHGVISRDAAYDLLRWVDPGRDTKVLRTFCAMMVDRGEPLWCVWSGKRLQINTLHVDHCFPFALWPCDDLWNLLPTSATANSAKRDRIISADLLSRQSDLIADWWRRAFLHNRDSDLSRRFSVEARTSLPTLAVDDTQLPDPQALLDGVDLIRLRLRSEQRVPEWHGVQRDSRS